MSNADFTDETTGNNSATSGVKVAKSTVIQEKIGESTTVIHRYQPPSGRWIGRLLNWFGQDDRNAGR